MQNIDFIKMHGLGNDFVIIDRRINNVEISKEFSTQDSSSFINGILDSIYNENNIGVK